MIIHYYCVDLQFPLLYINLESMSLLNSLAIYTNLFADSFGFCTFIIMLSVNNVVQVLFSFNNYTLIPLPSLRPPPQCWVAMVTAEHLAFHSTLSVVSTATVSFGKTLRGLSFPCLSTFSYWKIFFLWVWAGYYQFFSKPDRQSLSFN